MSTDHVLIEKPSGLQVSVLESSCEFDLDVQFQPGEEPQTLCRLSAEDLVKIARNLIKIASYSVAEGDNLLRRYNIGFDSEDLIVR